MISETKQTNETLLDELVEEICALLHAGTQVDLDRLAAEHPDLADQLRKLYPTLLAMTSLDESVASIGLLGGTGRDSRNHTLGDFQIVRQIGRGGMGVVYEAQQLSISRKVALKVLPLAALVDHRALQRFKNEVAAIATLEHPHIVSVYAIGEDRGIHYFAMQLIHGQSLAAVIRELRTRADQDQSVSGDAIQQAVSDIEKGSGLFCRNGPAGAAHKRVLTPFPDDETNTETRARGRSSTIRQVGDQTYFRNVVRLILQAADALQHAHDHGIVHRDVKPGNLLLDTHGSLFVTDFGLARIEAGAGVTMTGDVMGTLRYMSPEQILGNRVVIDHRTDIYSLGATLYELLTLQPVWSGDDRAELLRQISFEEPTRPQKISPAIPTDLETIVLKAISKNPNDRYDNAQAFADDLSCFLDLKPINAKRPTGLQRVAKWTRRNPAIMWSSVTVLMVLIASMLLGIVGLAHSNRMIAKREKEANDQRNRAVAAEGETKKRADELKLVSDFQASMLEQVDPTQAGNLLTEDVLFKFKEALTKADIPEAERTRRFEAFTAEWKNVNATDAARELIDRTILKPAVEAIDKRFANQPVVDAQLRQVLANRYRDLGLYDAALPLQERALAIRRRVLGEEHTDTLYSINRTGELLFYQHKLAEAEPYWREALEKYLRVLGNENPGTLLAINNLGILLLEQGKLSDAEPYLREALETRRRVLGEENPDTLESMMNLGELLHHQRKLSEAEPYLRKALETKRRVLGEEHKETLVSINNLGMLLQNQGKLSDAEPYLREALEKFRLVLGEGHPDSLKSIFNLAGLLMAQGKFSEAEPYYREALEKSRRVRGEDDLFTLASINKLGEVLRNQDKLDEAEPYLRESLEKNRRVRGEEHPITLIEIGNMGGLLLSQGKPSEAEPYFREALEKNRRVRGDENQETLNSINNLGVCLQDQGKLDEAEPYVRDAVEKGRRALGEEHPGTLGYVINLGVLLTAKGKHAETIDLLVPIEAASRKAFTGGNAWRLAKLMMALGEARAGLGEFAVAEENLLEAQPVFVQNRGPTHKHTRKCTQALVDFYTAWHAAEGDKSYDAMAAEWKTRLDAIPQPAADATPEKDKYD